MFVQGTKDHEDILYSSLYLLERELPDEWWLYSYCKACPKPLFEVG